MFRTTYLAVAGLVVLLTAPAHALPITNGTLNTNSTGWTLGGGCGDEVWDAFGNPGGSIRLNACGESNSDPFGSQLMTGLAIGTSYTISVDVHLHVASSGSGTGKTFGIFLDAEPNTPILLTEFLDGNWHTVTTNFVATAASQTLIFADELDTRTPGGPGINTDVSYYIDNISVNPVTASVPEPSGFLMLGGGLAALFLKRRSTKLRE